MMIRLIYIVTAFFASTIALSSPAVAGPPERWALRAGGVNLMVFEIEKRNERYVGRWIEPYRYSTNGEFFEKVSNETRSYRTRSARRLSDGGVELVFENPMPGGAPDRFTIKPEGRNGASMIWAAFKTVPYHLTRVRAKPPLGPWNTDRVYLPDTIRKNNPEMTAIFAADQADRANPANIDWNKVWPADKARQIRTQALIDNGALSSADDYYHAAYVFQHGENADDFLKAHALATVAIERGRADAAWIAAATLDRYLQNIGRPQIYGTQFNRPGKYFTQEPYRRDLIGDSIRAASNVPSLAQQDIQRRNWDQTMPPPDQPLP